MTEHDGVERSTATETFRAKLDERDVEWVGTDFTEPTSGHATNTSLGSEHHDAVFIEYVDGTALRLFDLTPEQAVEATLGREPDDAAMTKLHEQMNVALLKYEQAQGIEKRDGDEAIVVPFVVKMHSLLEAAATLGRGACRNASKVMDEHGQARFACSECGAWIDSRMLWNPEYRNGESPWVSDCKLNFCPNCGREVVTE